MGYLRLRDKDKIFATETLEILIEDRRTTHREKINKKRNVVTLQDGDIVIARREVISDKMMNRVGKLTYQVSGRFRITRSTGHGS